MITKRSSIWAPIVALSLFAAACGGGGGGATETPDDGGSVTEPMASEPTAPPATTAQPSEPVTPSETGPPPIEATRPPADDVLTIGNIRPETGSLAFLGAPQIAGFELAIADINAAGGVFGSDVATETGDEAGDPAKVREAAARLINAGVDAVVGAASSGMSQEFIGKLSEENIAQCSPSNTSPAFTTQENADFYFRTVPPDAAVAPVIANKMLADGVTNAVIFGRADDYGEQLAQLIEASLTEAGAAATTIIYPVEAGATYTSEVEQGAAAAPDGVAFISFDEGAQLMSGMIEAGISADTFYGGDGVFAPTLPALVDESNPNVLDGMAVIGASGGADFNGRLDETLPDDEKGNLIYGGQAYDCTVIIALAALEAGSADPATFIANVGTVTKDGEACGTFADCAALIEAGTDIDYDGASGPIELDDVGDAGFGRYAIAEFTAGALVTIAEEDVNVAEVG